MEKSVDVVKTSVLSKLPGDVVVNDDVWRQALLAGYFARNKVYDISKVEQCVLQFFKISQYQV